MRWKLFTGNNVEVLRREVPLEGIVDLTVTSPPYDGLRVYEGYELDIPGLASQLYRVTKDGGVVVWVVNDQTVDGDETGTSFDHARAFKDAGFRLHDTMIWHKTNPIPQDGRQHRYIQSFEYMFVFSKGKPGTFNGWTVPTKTAGKVASNNYPARRENGAKSFERTAALPSDLEVKKSRLIHNVVNFPVNNGKGDGFGIRHPAPFPEALVEFHVQTWSNPGDIVLDPFSGSGTTGKMAVTNGRKYVGIDVSRAYNEMAAIRLSRAQMPEETTTQI